MNKIMFWFEIDKSALGQGRMKFETEVDEGLNRLMCDIFNTIGNGDGENGGKGSLWNCAPEILNTLKNYDAYEYAGCSWRVLPMSHARFIKMNGWTLEGYNAIEDGWLCKNSAASVDDLRVDRYLLLHSKPLQLVNKLYLAAVKKDETIGTIIDWLEDWPSVDEIKNPLCTLM